MAFESETADWPELVRRLDAAGLPAFRLDAERRFASFNRAAEALLGRGAEQVLGRPFADLGDGEGFRASDRRLLRAFRDGRPDLVSDERLATPRGALLRLLCRLTIAREGEEFRGAFGTLTEVGPLLELMETVPPPAAASDDLGIVGESAAIVEARRLIGLAAKSEATVLVTGESGTGKELAARALHSGSARARGPFVPVNCGAIPSELLEAEFFGHVAGAFTGAGRDRRGLIESAEGGTLFLDEVGELPPAMQVKLLRVLQERRVRRVGGEGDRAVDLRLVAATNRDLEESLREGSMREDFYYRIHVFEIRMPALRERVEDVAALAAHFAAELGERLHRPVEGFSREALDALRRHPWPGNVRELANAVERALVTLRGGRIELEDLPPAVRAAAGDPDEEAAPILRPEDLAERRRIVEALDACGWNRTAAAERLGISRVTLWKKIRKHRIDRGRFRRG